MSGFTKENALKHNLLKENKESNKRRKMPTAAPAPVMTATASAARALPMPPRPVLSMPAPPPLSRVRLISEDQMIRRIMIERFGPEIKETSEAEPLLFGLYSCTPGVADRLVVKDSSLFKLLEAQAFDVKSTFSPLDMVYNPSAVIPTVVGKMLKSLKEYPNIMKRLALDKHFCDLLLPDPYDKRLKNALYKGVAEAVDIAPGLDDYLAQKQPVFGLPTSPTPSACDLGTDLTALKAEFGDSDKAPEGSVAVAASAPAFTSTPKTTATPTATATDKEKPVTNPTPFAIRSLDPHAPNPAEKSRFVF